MLKVLHFGYQLTTVKAENEGNIVP